MNHTSRNLSIFIFIIVFALKFSAIHTHTHCDDDNNEDKKECSTCILVLENQQEEFTLTDFNLELTPLFTSISSDYFEVNTVIYPKTLGDFHCSRPPPILHMSA